MIHRFFPKYRHHLRRHFLVTEDSDSLSELNEGEEAIILSFHGGKVVNSRLASLGLTPGVHVNMIQNYGHGPLIVIVRGSRIALGRGEAARIIIKRDAHD